MTGRRLLLALGAWLLIAIVAGVLTATVGPGLGIPDVTAVIVAEVYLILIVVLIAIVRPIEALGLTKFRWADVGLAAGVCGIAYVVSALLQRTFGPWTWSSTVAILKAMGSDDGRLMAADPTMAAIIIVRACALAAVAEELLFRGAFYAWLRTHLGPGAVIPITAGAHATIHMFPAVMPLAFLLGLGFGWIRERSGSTIPVIIVHGLHNAVLIGWAYLAGGWTARLPPWGG